MYQEAVEQAARGINIFEFAKFSLTCPGTEFGILQPNPELERLDAALAAMCQPEDDEFEDFPVIPRFTGRKSRLIKSLESAADVQHRASFFNPGGAGKDNGGKWGRAVRQDIHAKERRLCQIMFR